MLVIQAGRVLTPCKEFHEVNLLIEDGKILDIIPREEFEHHPNQQVVDALDLTLAPGFIDLHAHGGGGASVVDGTTESLDQISKYFARHGVTGYLPTVFGLEEDIKQGIVSIVEYLRHPEKTPGARILGIHIEGPFINREKAGAFHPDSILEANMELLKEFLEMGEGNVRMISIAPEIEGGMDLIRFAKKHSVVCSAGHTTATFEQMNAAIEAGVTHICHTFNAMPQLHHRQPGVLGAALGDDQLTAEMIVDGIHLHPSVVKLLVRAKKVRGAVLVTDSISASGMPDGVIKMEGQKVTIQYGSARLEDGTLAGSVLTMDQGVRNLVHFGAANIQEAIQTATQNPARTIGVESRKGKVERGMDADLIALDEQLRVKFTIVDGRIVYRY